MTPQQFAPFYIKQFEDGGSSDPNKTHSLDPDDAGNYTGGAVHVGVLVGSNHGVTPKALATFRGVPVMSITRAVMHALTLAEAAQVALHIYFTGVGLDKLIWNRVTASVFDFGWGVGAGTGIIHLYRVLGIAPDTKVGPVLIQDYAHWIKAHGESGAAKLWAIERENYYDAVIRSHPNDAQYHNSWFARTECFEPGGLVWKAWETGK